MYYYNGRSGYYIPDSNSNSSGTIGKDGIIAIITIFSILGFCCFAYCCVDMYRICYCRNHQDELRPDNIQV